MQSRFMKFDSHIQAVNRIEQLSRENTHLQKLLMSSQHDLRLLQRFTKNYFKSMEGVNLKEMVQNDAAEMKIVLQKCF